MSRNNFPGLCVSARFLIHWAGKEVPDGTKTSDLMAKMKQETHDQSISMAEYWHQLDPTAGTVVALNERLEDDLPFIYVIHPWSLRLKEDTLSAVEQYLLKIEKEDLFLWIDLFSLNMNTLQRQLRSFNWWGEQFSNTLSEFSEVLAIWDSQSLILQRSWCCWELYCALERQVPLAISLPEQETNLLQTFGDGESLSSLYDSYMNVMLGIRDFRVEHTECFDRRMRKRIFSALKKIEGGTQAFNSRALFGVTQWWALKGYVLLGQLREHVANLGIKDKRFPRFANGVSFALRVSEMPVEALDACSTGVEWIDKMKLQASFEEARDVNNLFVLHCENENYDEAMKFGQISVSLMRSQISKEKQKVGADIVKLNLMRSFLATALNNMGNLYSNLGETAETVAFYQESLDLKLDLYEPDHPSIALALNNLGGALIDQNDYAEAEKYLRRALLMRMKLFGPESLEVAQTHRNLAEALKFGGLTKEGKKEAGKALEIARKLLPADHPIVEVYANFFETF